MKFKIIFPLPLLLGSICAASGGTAKLDQVLAELASLNDGLRRLEARMDNLESQIVTVATEAVQSTAATSSTTTASSGQGSETFIQRVVEAVKEREEQVNYPWMDLSKWKALEKGMSLEEVVNILGEPTLEDPSLHKRIDTVYTYRGRRPATGEKLIGKVKFYKGELAEISAP